MFFGDIPILQLQDLTWLAGVAFVGITSFVQAFSKKFSPWTWILEQIGKSINKESLQKLEEINKKVVELEGYNKKQDESYKLSQALLARRRILLCADGLSHRPQLSHTQEFYNGILEDIKLYKNYCNTHPKFENEKAVASIKLVKKTYEKCLEEDSFL